jgi:ribokinase
VEQNNAASWQQAKVLLTCLESPLEAVESALWRAKAAGITTILNPAPAPGDSAALSRLLPHVDILTPNVREAEMLSGMNIHDARDAERAAARLRELGCRWVVLTRGADGVLLHADEIRQVAARRVVAVDTTAAGDAFNGALAAAWAEGHTPLAAVRLANAAAAISVTREGAQPSLPRRDEITRLLAAAQ